MSKKIELSENFIKDLYNLRYSRKDKIPGWEFVSEDNTWDGGEERTKDVVVRNIKEDYYLSISNGYDSWGSYWDPYVQVVTPIEKVVTITEFVTVDGVEVVV